MAPTATTVTLWQFGRFRLLPGDSTLPLQPLGTASDGSATTYLYQVTNPKLITTDQSGFTTTTTPPMCLNINHTSTVTANSGYRNTSTSLSKLLRRRFWEPQHPPKVRIRYPFRLRSRSTMEINPGEGQWEQLWAAWWEFCCNCDPPDPVLFLETATTAGVHEEVSPIAYDPIIEGFDNSARPGLERATTYDTVEAGLPTSQLESTATNPPSRLASNSAASPATQRNRVKVRRTEANLGDGGVAPSQTADIPTSELIATLLQRIDDRERWVEQPPPVYET
ncbi:hypothetical protein B0H13DRAFT_1935344 [Mycena leptocephala]|nr:hypothetical protein B0H13DRAFT_1935344 [Mycena leptocephala]